MDAFEIFGLLGLGVFAYLGYAAVRDQRRRNAYMKQMRAAAEAAKNRSYGRPE